MRRKLRAYIIVYIYLYMYFIRSCIVLCGSDRRVIIHEHSRNVLTRRTSKKHFVGALVVIKLVVKVKTAIILALCMAFRTG